MNKEELDRFNEADKVVHTVETQWHYPIMTKAGFEPVTKTGIGFSRSYTYVHPLGYKIRVTTGISADYFNDETTKIGKFGYWGELEPHLKKEYNLLT